MNDWQITCLGQVTHITTGFPFKSSSYVDAEDGVRLLRGDNIVQGALRWDSVKRWSALETSEFSNFALQVSDVVLAMDRPWIEAGLKFSKIRDSDIPCLLVQRVARLRGTDALDQDFLYFVIASQEFTNYVLGVQTGTAVPHISPSQIKAFKFKMPPLPKQRAIATILGALNEKIEINRKMNETLEAMAAALFYSWFIDFEPVRENAAGVSSSPFQSLFPAKFDSSGWREIPIGWKWFALDEIAVFLNGLALQKFPPEGTNYLPVIKIGELRRGITESSGRASINLDQKYIVEDGDILFSWSGSLEAVQWSGGCGALNQHLFKVTSDDFPKWFYFFWVLHHLDEFRSIAADKATTMGHIQRRHLTQAKVAVPSPEVLAAADAVLSPILQRQLENNLESRSLAATRDFLLPRLLSGEVRVNEMPTLAAQAVSE